MSYQGQDPNQQNQYPGYGNYNPSQPQPQPTDPYSGQRYGQQGPQSGPQSGYQQPNYGQQPPYGQAQYGQPGATSIGMSQNTAAGLSYVFTVVSGLIIFFVEKQNRFVRFHAAQSIIFFGGFFVLDIALGILTNLPILGFVFAILSPLLSIAVFVGWIVLMVNGFQGKYFKLPVIGDYAERWANQSQM